MKTRTLKLNKLPLPLIFWGMVFAFVLMAGLYCYLINKTVWNVVSRQRMETQIASMHSSVGVLENSYISMKDGINLQMAHSLGYVSAQNPKYVTRTATLGRLSVNSVE